MNTNLPIAHGTCKVCKVSFTYNPIVVEQFCSDECEDDYFGHTPVYPKHPSTDDGYDAYRDGNRGAFRSTYHASDYRYGSWDH